MDCKRVISNGILFEVYIKIKMQAFSYVQVECKTKLLPLIVHF